MSRVITFSRVFPAYHPKKGQPTYFVEAILAQLGIQYKTGNYLVWLIENNPRIDEGFLVIFFDSLKRGVEPKSHTIRSHKRPLKPKDYIDPHCWAGKPYNKTKEGYWQIKFAPDLLVKKTWDFEMDLNGIYSINGKYIHEDIDDTGVSQNEETLARNDGLTSIDMQHWFMPNMDKPKEFKGQIICWSENINY